MAEPQSRREIVDAVFATGRYDLRTKAGCGCFTEEVAFRLHTHDSAWGHLKKSGGQNQWNGHAVDALLHAPSGYAVDIIVSSESDEAKPAWGVDHRKEDGGPRYPNRPDLFMVPTQGCAGGPIPEPGPMHQYDGGGNDTGICDTCGQPRGAAVHQTPASKLPHTYDGGEQDTGFCDVCQRVASDPIHHDGPIPEPVDLTELKARIAILEAAVTQQKAVIASVTERVEALEDAPPAALPDLVAVGTTGRAVRHAHPVRLKVVKA